MIWITTSQGIIGVVFRHLDDMNPTLWKSVTQCYLYHEKETTPFATGVAMCSLKDQLRRETGRRVSLAKALSTFPRTIRKEVWEGYFKTKGVKNAPLALPPPDGSSSATASTSVELAAC